MRKGRIIVLLLTVLVLCVSAVLAQGSLDLVLDEDEAHYRTETVNGGIAITGYMGTEQSLVFPATLGGKTVVRVGSDKEHEAFEFCNFVQIVIPEGVTTLGAYAFANCSTLQLVTLPASIASFPGIDTLFSGVDLANITLVVPSDSRADAFAQKYGITAIRQDSIHTNTGKPTQTTATENYTIPEEVSFSVKATSSTAFEGYWDKIPGASEYTVQILRNGVFTDKQSFKNTKTTGKVTKLAKGQTYTARLKVTFENGEEVFSNKAVVTLIRPKPSPTTTPDEDDDDDEDEDYDDYDDDEDDDEDYDDYDDDDDYDEEETEDDDEDDDGDMEEEEPEDIDEAEEDGVDYSELLDGDQE